MLARNLADGGWQRVDLLDRVESTNAEAAREAAAWRLVAAHEQFGGRGRMDRRWVVPPGAAATLSMTVPLPASPSAWGWAPLLIGDAVRGAIHELAQRSAMPLQVGTKWPNDVLVRSGPGSVDGPWSKVSGVLCQVVQPAVGPALVVAGVGVNVSQTPDELPVQTATSLRRRGLEVSRDEVLAAVARHVRHVAVDWGGAGIGALQERMRRSCLTIGADVEVHTPDGGVHPRRAIAIDESGRLVTVAPGEHADRGSRMVFSVADVVHARLPRP